MARSDTYPNYDRNLKTQFDQTHPLFKTLEENYELSVQDYFQTGVMYFDTNIIKRDISIYKFSLKTLYSLQ